ncbi:MAG: redoxin domain-containing protein [Planctomycetes bacterium]|nr:redoxin domain-containing protein [Planctomycetota bacterium]MCB9889281.1 redoxin domain-containing protein [Planctomycetota bacterium]
MEALLDRFRAAGTQVLGASVDSVYCHANWASSLGGISFPLLADFQPKGAAAQSLGLYLADKGITDRATVLIDREGIVRYAHSVGPGGRRDIAALAAECERIGGPVLPGPGTVAGTLFVKSKCGPSRAARLAVDNLHLAATITVRNVNDDPAARADLAGHGKDQAPCLVVGTKALYESAEIIGELARRTAPLPG